MRTMHACETGDESNLTVHEKSGHRFLHRFDVFVLHLCGAEFLSSPLLFQLWKRQ